MSTLTTSQSGTPPGKAALAAAALSGVALEKAEGALCLTLADGSSLTLGDAILRELSAAPPTAASDEWLDFVSSKLQGPLTFLTYPLMDRLEGCGPAFVALHPRQRELVVMPKAWRSALADLKTVDARLAASPFLAGDALSVADVSLACWMDALYSTRDRISVATPEEIDGLANVKRWYLACLADASLASLLTAELQEGVVPAGAKKKKKGKQQQKGQKGKQQQKKGGGGKQQKKAAASKPPLSMPTPLATAGGIAFTGVFRRERMRVADALIKAEALVAAATPVTVCGWARSVRKARKDTLMFIEVSDGSCVHTLQCVVESTAPGFTELAEGGGTGCSLEATGVLVANARDPAGRPDVKCTSVRLLGPSHDFPIAKKQHKLETLRSVQLAHLRPRTNTLACVARVRSALAFATHEFFNKNGFQYVHTPIITASDCEGAGEMFAVTTLLSKAEEHAKAKGGPVTLPLTPEGKVDYTSDFFDKPAFLTVSGQLNVETYACALSDVYTFGPTFRAEYSFTSRHLSEFWMIEPEICFADLETNMNLAEDYVKYCVTYALENCRPDLEFFDQNVEEGLIARLQNVLAAPFQRITYTEAVELLTQPEHLAAGGFEEAPFWGIDLGSEHERYLTEKVFKKPTIVTDYPKDFKAFYMKQNEDGKTVRAMDILVPKIGELIGGSQREEDFEKLKAMMVEKDVGQEGLQWYMDLRKYGSVPHSGFGLGFERLVLFVTGMENIRDVIPYPRWPKNADF